jgi:hypothetical protein
MRLGNYTVAAWLEKLWLALGAGEELDSRFRGYERAMIGTMFSAVLDDDDPFPTSESARWQYVRAHLDADAEEHFIRAQDDDDEGTDYEVYIFDHKFLSSPDALERLPHPRRGSRPVGSVDRYLTLVTRLKSRN